MPVTTGRLIPLHACGGADNMATDQALLESVDNTGQPVLRYYAWQAPTLSLGYFQRLEDRTEHADSGTIHCVRRATGGGAIVHHHELTYSLAIPSGNSSAGPRQDIYQRTHHCLIEALQEHGVVASPYRATPSVQRSGTPDPFLCFQRRTDEDLIVSGYKIAGSAQRKSRNALLQHGSVLLRASHWAPQLPGINDLTAREIPIENLAESFAKRLGSALSIGWCRGELTEAERERTTLLVHEKFATDLWLRRR